ncbi:MAG: hypothetical protein HDR36_10005 [Treponema sp.]|nr:hypothetical protein [Treponema sp.]MBD5437316.1 hypothetical protein [Treponema sp.]MDE6067872.1 hypothetical protein [Treponemataceae bacterium]
MVSLIFGIIFIAFTVFSVLPAAPLAWGDNVVEFLKGFLPVLSAFIGLVAILIGIADIKDKKEAKREEIEAAKTSK